jgi:DNA-binding MarR family transcriptional regulator
MAGAAIVKTKPYRGLAEDIQYPWRTENLGRLLLVALANWQEALVEGLREAGFSTLSTTHINLLRHIDLSGTRITEIAERARITKQAVGQLVVACAELDLVRTVCDPSDRRAKMVLYTELGKAVILAQLNVILRIDAELDKLLGAAEHQRLRRILAKFSELPKLLPAATVPAARPGPSKRRKTRR